MPSVAPFAIGLDYGTNSVRCLIARVSDGFEVGTAIAHYHHGDMGVVIDSRFPDLARQHPVDYLQGAEESVRAALAVARDHYADFRAENVVAIGVDSTGSTPLPVDVRGRALAEAPAFSSDPNAMAWLWKDHTATTEARALTERAAVQHPEYLAKCGGIYSSEWFWAKIWHCANVAPHVVSAAHSWIELADWIPAILSGTESNPVRGICAAGHKAMYNDDWGGYPDAAFLRSCHPYLGELRQRLGAHRCLPVNQRAGQLSPQWAARLGLTPGIPVAVGAFDAHLGAVGSGVAPGTLVKILGTSTCDIMVAPLQPELPDIPGLCGIVPNSVLPGFYGLEAGQSAVGDIFHWFVQRLAPVGATHDSLTVEAARLVPGQSGLLALDWHNGNRTVLVDQRLTGLLVGQTLATRPAEIYRALMEATAFGARIIIERLEQFGVRAERIVNCGGIAEKSPLLLQIYADVTGRPMQLSRSSQTCALGAAIAAAVCAGSHPDIPAAQHAMTALKPIEFTPRGAGRQTYDELFPLYRMLHDAFGLGAPTDQLGRVMKRLLDIRDRTQTP